MLKTHLSCRAEERREGNVCAATRVTKPSSYLVKLYVQLLTTGGFSLQRSKVFNRFNSISTLSSCAFFSDAASLAKSTPFFSNPLIIIPRLVKCASLVTPYVTGLFIPKPSFSHRPIPTRPRNRHGNRLRVYHCYEQEPWSYCPHFNNKGEQRMSK